MRRWRLADGRTLAEAPSVGKVQYYLLDRAGQVERVFSESATSVDGEVHRLSFVVLGRQLMRRHVVERASVPTDMSGVELDNLTQLTPAEAPVEAQVREAIVRHKAGAHGGETERQGKIDAIAEAAGPGVRAIARELGARIVRHDDDLARGMLSSLRSLAEVHRSRGASESLRAATEAIALAARFVNLEPGLAGSARTAPAGDEATRALIDKLDALRERLRGAAEAQGTASDPAAASEAGRAYREAAELLRVAIHHLLALG